MLYGSCVELHSTDPQIILVDMANLIIIEIWIIRLQPKPIMFLFLFNYQMNRHDNIIPYIISGFYVWILRSSLMLMLKLSITILAFALIGGVDGQPIGGGPTVWVLSCEMRIMHAKDPWWCKPLSATRPLRYPTNPRAPEASRKPSSCSQQISQLLASRSRVFLQSRRVITLVICAVQWWSRFKCWLCKF